MQFQEVKTHEITTDVVIFTIKNNKLQVLLVKRANEPFKGRWAIPGGFIRLSENLDNAALRILKEKTNVDNIYLVIHIRRPASLPELKGYNLCLFCFNQKRRH